MAVASRSAWLLGGVTLATLAVHREIVAVEEVALSHAFGVEYDEYRASTPRYLSISGR
jgi:protein-S-isoprenylcysteine O-methyltransferase Ste14